MKDSVTKFIQSDNVPIFSWDYCWKLNIVAGVGALPGILAEANAFVEIISVMLLISIPINLYLFYKKENAKVYFLHFAFIGTIWFMSFESCGLYFCDQYYLELIVITTIVVSVFWAIKKTIQIKKAIKEDEYIGKNGLVHSDIWTIVFVASFSFGRFLNKNTHIGDVVINIIPIIGTLFVIKITENVIKQYYVMKYDIADKIQFETKYR